MATIVKTPMVIPAIAPGGSIGPAEGVLGLGDNVCASLATEMNELKKEKGLREINECSTW
jgi:hypothetical protein